MLTIDGANSQFTTALTNQVFNIDAGGRVVVRNGGVLNPVNDVKVLPGGTLTLDGATVRTSGGLIVGGRLEGRGSIVASASGLDFNAGRVAPGVGVNGVGTLATNSTVTMIEPTLEFDLGTPANSDRITTTRNFISLFLSPVHFQFHALDGFGPGTYTLLTATQGINVPVSSASRRHSLIAGIVNSTGAVARVRTLTRLSESDPG